jgi:hypothetical protein
MTVKAQAEQRADSLQQYLPALSYKAPFLIEKLLMEHIVETPAEREALFAEVKKFIILDRSSREMNFQMHSRRIDEAWHQFILFTNEYTKFCNHFFGRYVHHAPSNAPKPPGFDQGSQSSTIDDFRSAYETAFGTSLPDIWFDDRSISINTRILNDHVGVLAVQVEHGMANLFGPACHTAISVSEVALGAIEFITRTSTFYIRELPGDLLDEEKMSLVRMLTYCGILQMNF